MKAFKKPPLRVFLRPGGAIKTQAKQLPDRLTALELCQRGQRDGNQSEKHGKNGGNNELFHYFVSLG
ncbi:hypothetical protein [Aeromonas media]|uniref:hypothetical protein n=1 Tax=Aeromonas media TaxID=651 RepID=UPI0038CFF6F8